MTNYFKVLAFCLLTLILSSSSPAAADRVNIENIKNASLYPGPKTEKKLNDLLRSDYHQYLSEYYIKKEQAGFMALERFELALTRAVGDIRILSEIKDLTKRQSLAVQAFNNWTAGFKRAQVSNMPK